MLQREVRKKTEIYGIIAILSALLLFTFIYSAGTTLTPRIPASSSSTTPQPNNPSQTSAPIPVDQNNPGSGMKSFSSVNELIYYINTSTGNSSSYIGGPLDSQYFSQATRAPEAAGTSTTNTPQTPEAAPALQAPQGSSAASSASYSTTNIQVAGVDEADTVKTDGTYIYVATNQAGYYFGGSSSQNNAVFIVNADPRGPRVVAKITLGNGTQPAGLFLSQDGKKLVVLGSKYQIYPIRYGVGAVSQAGTPSSALAMPMIPFYRANVHTFIDVYDVSNHALPVLTRNLTVTGSYFNSRMISNYVYAVVSQPAIVFNKNVTLPAIYDGNKASSVPPTSIYYSSMAYPTYYTYTTFFGVNVLDDKQQATNMTVMMGGASTMYVSPSNIYVTYPSWKQSGQYTSIYRVSVNDAKLTFEAQGNVSGYLINQYSMDEYNGYFRVATTSVNSTQTNNIYVLDSKLGIAGKLEGMAQGERIFSSRFMGNKCYLVTFKQTDPFFIIDLSNPLVPKVAGELKIPGYSSFLQPYDENHVIGLGMENNMLKLSLFDVSNVNSPTEISKYIVQGNYTYSTALYDPKAILFDLQKQLLVIPVSIDNYAYQSPTTPPPSAGSTSQQGGPTVIKPPIIVVKTQYWQGAYVFSLNLNTGFTLKGKVTQLNATLLDSQGFIDIGTAYYDYQNNLITRALYIGSTLYTVSNSEIRLNSLTDLTEIATVNLN